MATARRHRVGVERIHGRQRLGLEQPPQAVAGKVPAYVRRRRQQQEAVCAPVQPPARDLAGDAEQCHRGVSQVSSLSVKPPIPSAASATEFLRYHSPVSSPGDRTTQPLP
jgi:hypothetical protein